MNKEKVIRQLVKSNVETFADTFSGRHIGEVNNPDGTLNMKIHNVFIAVLGEELKYYTALVRSFDSTLGNMLERLAINIAELFFEVHRDVNGYLYDEQTNLIAQLLEKYKTHEKAPSINDYKNLRIIKDKTALKQKRHDSDYYLIDTENKSHNLIELKIGGDLDNKKARSEKEAILEQYCILSNQLEEKAEINLYFATAYNRFGEDKEWNQGRVLQFFSKDELLIGKDFWNFVCKSNSGYEIVIDEYKKNSKTIKIALENIKTTYLG